MVLLEAMALGLACVSFDCPSGPREISRGGEDAVLVGQNDEDALARAMAMMMSEEALRNRLGASAATSVQQRYSIETILTQWDDLFDQLRLRPQ